MAALNTLPTEVLHGIVSYISPDFTELRNCSLVCRALWDIASSALYSHIDLAFDEHAATKDKEKTERRQLRLLQSLAENPKLGAMVRSFKNLPLSIFNRRSKDATLSDNTSMIVKAAENLTHLSTASLTSNPLSAHIIANLQSYPQLDNLHVYGLQPEEHVWKMAPVSLKTLKWEIQTNWAMMRPGQNAWDIAQFVVNVAEATCPDLESLDLSVVTMRRTPPALSVVLPERSEQYRQMDPSLSTKLMNLLHFGFKFGYCATELVDIEAQFLSFVQRHGQSLRSISIPVNYGSPVKEQLDFILKVCGLLPNLKDLRLATSEQGRDGQVMSGHDFYHALTTALTSPKFSIERFSAMNIGAPFSPTIGNMFRSWNSLKFLRLGDADNNRTNSPYGNDGRPDFRAYRPAILGFIKKLPPSLEELYMEINGEGLWCDEDSDFDPVCNLGTPIFDALRRLHTCDIHAWVSSCDGGLGQIPEKGVFYRRLTHQPSTPDDVPLNKIKDVWTSRMDCIYQDENRNVSVECVEVELEDHEGVFEGKDAEGVWCDGFEFELAATRGGTQRGRPPCEHNQCWPFWEDKVGSYAMFRKRFYP